jgi:PAS domain S-box-containing protein
MSYAWFQPILKRHRRLILASGMYVVLFFALDQIAASFEIESIVSLWYPSSGISLVFIIGFGTACIPALLLANLLTLHLHYNLALDWSALVIALTHMLCYGAGGLSLRRILSNRRLDTIQAMSRFLVVGVLSSIPLAFIACAALALDGELAWSQYPQSVFGWWLGDQIGIVVIVPLLLVHLLPRLRIWGPQIERLRPSSLSGWVELIIQTLSVVGTLFLVFVSPLAAQRPLYLCFLPLIWVVLRFGLPGATIAMSGLSFGAMIATAYGLFPLIDLVDLQLFMLAIAVTGLLLGASVSEQRNTARALQASEARARAIVQEQTDLVCRYRPDTTLTFVNDAYCRFFGQTAETLLGRSFIEMARPEYHATIYQQIATLLATRESIIDESLIQRSDGTLRWMQWVNQVIIDPDGPMVEIQVVGRDITERRQAEEAYRSLVDQSLQGLAILQDIQIVFVNPALCAMLGYTSEELLALRDVQLLIDPADRDHIIELALLLPHDRERRSIEVRANRKDGHQRWLQVFLTEATTANFPALMIMAIDITARKEAEVARQQAEERYRRISQMTSDYSYMFTVDSDGTMRRDWVAGAFTRITGYDLEEFDHKGGWEGIVHTDDLPQVFVQRAKIEQGIAYELDLRILHKDGSIRWLHDTIQPELDPITGKLVRLYGAVQDITARKQAEETRQQAEERYRMISQMTSDYGYVYTRNANGVMRRDWLAGAFTRITGYDLEEFDRNGGWEAIVHPEDVPDMLAKRALQLQGIAYVLELRIIRKDGSIRWLQNNVRPEMDAETGQLARIYGAVQDISERKQAEETRRAIDRQIQETQKLESIGLLAGGIAHDFNNLLVGVMGNAGLALAELPDDSPARISVQQIEIAAQHAADLTRQLLAYAGKSRVIVRRLLINPLIEEMIQLLHVGIPRHVELIAHLGSDLPEIEGDVIQLRQVLMNVVINASEAIGLNPGVITIATDTRWIDRLVLANAYLGSDLPEQEYVVIEVTDTGCGMDAATCARIFEPFFTTKFTGRGLGLAAVLGIVRSHHGALTIASVPDQGSMFTILLPRATAPSLQQAILLPEHNQAFR